MDVEGSLRVALELAGGGDVPGRHVVDADPHRLGRRIEGGGEGVGHRLDHLLLLEGVALEAMSTIGIASPQSTPWKETAPRP